MLSTQIAREHRQMGGWRIGVEFVRFRTGIAVLGGAEVNVAAMSGARLALPDFRTNFLKDWLKQLVDAVEQIDWVPDLGREIGSTTWLRGVLTLTLPCAAPTPVPVSVVAPAPAAKPPPAKPPAAAPTPAPATALAAGAAAVRGPADDLGRDRGAHAHADGGGARGPSHRR